MNEKPQVAPRLPPIIDLSGDEVGLPSDTHSEPAEIIYVSRRQLHDALREVERVGELPASTGVKLAFVPFGPGYLGIPFCSSADPEHDICYPVRQAGLSYMCDCVHHERNPPDPRDKPGPGACHLVFSLSPYRLECAGVCKTGDCRLVSAGGASGKGTLRGSIIVWCACG